MKTDRVGLLVLLLSLLAGHVAVADWRVGTVTETRHVLRSDPPGSDLAVKVAAARNEWVSFQILVRSDEPMRDVGVEAGALRGPGGVWSAFPSRRYLEQRFGLRPGSPWTPLLYPWRLVAGLARLWVRR